MKADDICKDMAKDAWNYELNSLLLKGKNKNVIGVMKDELCGKIIKEFVGLGTKTYSYLIMVLKIKNQKAQKVYHKKTLNLKNIKTA